MIRVGSSSYRYPTIRDDGWPRLITCKAKYGSTNKWIEPLLGNLETTVDRQNNRACQYNHYRTNYYHNIQRESSTGNVVAYNDTAIMRYQGAKRIYTIATKTNDATLNAYTSAYINSYRKSVIRDSSCIVKSTYNGGNTSCGGFRLKKFQYARSVPDYNVTNVYPSFVQKMVVAMTSNCTPVDVATYVAAQNKNTTIDIVNASTTNCRNAFIKRSVNYSSNAEDTYPLTTNFFRKIGSGNFDGSDCDFYLAIINGNSSYPCTGVSQGTLVSDYYCLISNPMLEVIIPTTGVFKVFILQECTELFNYNFI